MDVVAEIVQVFLAHMALPIGIPDADLPRRSRLRGGHKTDRLLASAAQGRATSAGVTRAHRVNVSV